MKNTQKYPLPNLLGDDTDFSDIHIEVKRDLVGETWSNVSGEFAPVNTPGEITEKMENKPKKKPW